MRPHDQFRAHNGAGSASSGSAGSGGDSGDSGTEDAEKVVVSEGSPAAALRRLNALRKSRQHYDVLLVAGGVEVAAHRAVLAAHSAYLLDALSAPLAAPPGPAGSPEPPAVPAFRVDGVAPDALRELVEYAYTGRLRVSDVCMGRSLYIAAWRLRMETARCALAAALLRRPTPAHCLELRALPDLPADQLHALDEYIAHNFDEICASGALAALPVIRMEMLRVTSAHGGTEAPTAVADAALAWLREQAATSTLEELCSRTHLLYVDGEGALRDCGQLPAARGDGPELQEYRREAAARERRAATATTGTQPRPLVGLELGARAARPDCAVLAARGTDNGGVGRVTRALLVVRGGVAGARLCWRDVAAGAAGGPPNANGPRPAALGPPAPAAALPNQLPALAHARCALGAAGVGGRLIACGGYDRARALRTAEAYCPRDNRWEALPDMRGARARFPAARLGRCLYVIGGSDGHNELDSVDVYEEGEDGTGKWSACSRLPLAVSHAGAAGVPGPTGEGGAILVVGGWAGGRPRAHVWRFRPQTGQWEQAPPLNTARSQCAAVWCDGAVWALGGCDAWHCLASTERLQLSDDHEGMQWEMGPALPTARRSVGGCVWGGAVWAAGGSDGAASLRAVVRLPPGGTQWLPAPALRRPRAGLALADLGGALYAVGGFDGKEFLSCMECLYEPDGEWTSIWEAPRPGVPLSHIISHAQSLQLEDNDKGTDTVTDTETDNTVTDKQETQASGVECTVEGGATQ